MNDKSEDSTTSVFDVPPYSRSGKKPPDNLEPGHYRFEDSTPVEWSGVKSCEARWPNELSSRLDQFVSAQAAKHPDMTLVDAGYKTSNMNSKQIKELDGRRHCRVTGQMARWAIFLKPK